MAQDHDDIWGIGGIALHILNLTTLSGQLHLPATLSPGKEQLVCIG